MLKLLDYEQGVTILVGNKTDLPNRQVTEEEAQNWANEKKIPYVEISCKENENVFAVLSQPLSPPFLTKWLGLNMHRQRMSSGRSINAKNLEFI
mmetsp:Transcript_13665/g.21169  ORF Transcript_13665/g.21169 Transcript_13665/m.21169 type:complete len:94 (+) Transcript_13665:446-727(+)